MDRESRVNQYGHRRGPGSLADRLGRLRKAKRRLERPDLYGPDPREARPVLYITERPALGLEIEKFKQLVAAGDVDGYLESWSRISELLRHPDQLVEFRLDTSEPPSS